MKTMIFTVTSGRSGSVYLTKVLQKNLGNARVYHERFGPLEYGSDTPDISHLKQFNTFGCTAHVKSFWRRKFKRALEEPGLYYAEISHVLGKAGLVEALASLPNEVPIKIIYLKRPAEKVGLSLFNRQEFQNVGWSWPFLLDPCYKNVLVNSEPFLKWGAMGAAYWYALEMEARAAYYHCYVEINESVQWIETSAEVLSEASGVHSLLAAVSGQQADNVVIPKRQNETQSWTLSDAQYEAFWDMVANIKGDPRQVGQKAFESGRCLGNGPPMSVNAEVAKASDIPQPDIRDELLGDRFTLSLETPHYLTKGRHGWFAFNHFDGYVGKAMGLYGEYCEHEVDLLKQLVKPGNVFWDVGANIGALTVPLAQAVGETGAVVAFEPQPMVFHLLAGNVAANNLTNTRCLPYALSDASGTVSMPNVNYDAPGNFGAIAMKQDSAEGMAEIPAMRGDSLHYCKTPDVIKIDVEGMEEAVLRGLEETLRSQRPFLYLENDRVDNSKSLIEFLWLLEYVIYWHVTPYYNNSNSRGVVKNLWPNTCSFNMLGIPDERAINIKTNLIRVNNSEYHPLIR